MLGRLPCGLLSEFFSVETRDFLQCEFFDKLFGDISAPPETLVINRCIACIRNVEESLSCIWKTLIFDPTTTRTANPLEICRGISLRHPLFVLVPKEGLEGRQLGHFFRFKPATSRILAGVVEDCDGVGSLYYATPFCRSGGLRKQSSLAYDRRSAIDPIPGPRGPFEL